MNKRHNQISLIIALLTLVLTQVFIIPFPVFRFVIPLRVVWIIIVAGYNYWYLKQIGKYNVWILLRSVLLFSGLFGLFSILPNSFLRGVFLISSVVVVGFFEWFLGSFSENIILNETVLMAFAFFVAFSAANWYFPRYEILYTMMIFVCTFLLTRSVYEFIPQPEPVKTSSSIVLALFCSEVFWAFTFLPFHYSVLGLLLFNIFYFVFILNYYYFINTYSRKKFQLHLVLFLITSFIVLTATPWHILT